MGDRSVGEVADWAHVSRADTIARMVDAIVVNLFCGAGGLARGLEDAGLDADDLEAAWEGRGSGPWWGARLASRTPRTLEVRTRPTGMVHGHCRIVSQAW